MNPLWMTRTGLDHRTRLMAMPAVPDLWHAGDDLCWHTDEHLWVPVADRVVAVPFGDPRVVVATAAGLFASDDDGRTLRVVHGVLSCADAPGRRAGLDTLLEPSEGGWQSHRRLPWGARRSRRAEPFAVGDGLFWADDAWLLRQRADAPPRALGAVDDDEVILTGPDGSVLVGNGTLWTRAAAPHGTLRALPDPIDAYPVPRWSADGTRLAAVAAGESLESIVVDLTTMSVVVRRAGAIPTSTETGWFPATGVLGRLRGGGEPASLSSCHWAMHGDRLAGPGGQLWDLAHATPVTALPPDAELVFPGSLWLVTDRRGQAHWLDPATGEHLDTVDLDLDADDAVVSGKWKHDALVLKTVGQARCTLAPPKIQRVAAPDDPAVRTATPPEWERIGVTHAARTACHQWGWNDDGLLLRGPA